MRNGKAFQEAGKTSFKEGFVQILGTAWEEEFDLDAVTLCQPLRSLLGLQKEVVFTGSNLNLDTFNLDGLSFALNFLLFFLLVVLELSEICDFTDRRNSVRGDLNEIKLCVHGLTESFGK